MISAEQLSAYCFELDHLLSRIEGAATHYQVLGLDRLAATGEVKIAYLRAVAILHPSFFNMTLEAPEPDLPRIDEAFERVSRAFSVLVSFNRRVEYDNLLGPDADLGAPQIEDRRRNERFMIAVPVRVIGHDFNSGQWVELTQTLDISRTGIMLRMDRGVQAGNVFHLELSLPDKMRDSNSSDSIYSAYAIVRRIELQRGGDKKVGLEFLGDLPPQGFKEKPWAVFHTGDWSGVERRRGPRQYRSEHVYVEYLTGKLVGVDIEIARSENLGSGGMRLCVLRAPESFDVVKVWSSALQLETYAEVCSRYTGADGIERLCLKFLDYTPAV